MINVETYFGLRKQAGKGFIGVEIEVEGSNLPSPPELNHIWQYTRDGSLRGESLEYVFAKPLSFPDTVNAINALKTAFKDNKGVVNDSMRAGVHVHLNVRRLTLPQLFTICACYYILEELITRSAGSSRQGNMFALRLVDAYEPVYRIATFLRSGNVSQLSSDEIRYAALNLASINKHGSIEFRQMRTPTDFSKVIRWVELLFTLYTNAPKIFSSPLDALTQFSGGGERQFILDLLGEDLANEFILCHKDFESVSRTGARFVQDFAYILTSDEDWSRLDLIKDSKIPKYGRTPSPLEDAINQILPVTTQQEEPDVE